MHMPVVAARGRAAAAAMVAPPPRRGRAAAASTAVAAARRCSAARARTSPGGCARSTAPARAEASLVGFYGASAFESAGEGPGASATDAWAGRRDPDAAPGTLSRTFVSRRPCGRLSRTPASGARGARRRRELVADPQASADGSGDAHIKSGRRGFEAVEAASAARELAPGSMPGSRPSRATTSLLEGALARLKKRRLEVASSMPRRGGRRRRRGAGGRGRCSCSPATGRRGVRSRGGLGGEEEAAEEPPPPPPLQARGEALLQLPEAVVNYESEDEEAEEEEAEGGATGGGRRGRRARRAGAGGGGGPGRRRSAARGQRARAFARDV